MRTYIFTALIITILLSMVVSVMAEEETKKETPKINIKFLFVMCNDVDEMRHFYTDLLGMNETNYMNEEDWAWLVYTLDGFQFMFFRAHGEMPIIAEWVWQPGWGGDVDGTSWAVEIPESMFADTVKAIRDDGNVKLWNEWPEWRQESYWGLTVKDPMGNSVEVYSTPSRKPDSTDWPAE